MATVELIGVPFDGYGRPGNQASAARVLRESGLVSAWSAHHEVADDSDLVLPPADPNRGPRTGLVNEAALLAVSGDLAARVEGAVGAGRFPVVFGGDCSLLLGVGPALRALGGVGLVFLDGHEDTMPLDVSEDGEAANTEIGLLLGITGRTLGDVLVESRGAVDRRSLAVLGPRDDAWRAQFNVGTLADAGVWLRTADQTTRDPAGLGVAAAEHVRRADPRWWLHVDLDVLDPEALPAQGLPGVPDEPGGLSWEQLEALMTSAVQQGGCVGLSVVIYDPDQDPERSDARRIVELIGAVAAVV